MKSESAEGGASRVADGFGDPVREKQKNINCLLSSFKIDASALSHNFFFRKSDDRWGGFFSFFSLFFLNLSRSIFLS